MTTTAHPAVNIRDRATEFAFTSNAAMNGYYPFTQIQTISPRPLLFIAGENAHSRYFSEDAYNQAAEPKELVIVPKARDMLTSTTASS